MRPKYKKHLYCFENYLRDEEILTYGILNQLFIRAELSYSLSNIEKHTNILQMR